LEDSAVARRKILKWILEKQGVKVCTGFNWLRTGSNSGIFWIY